MSYTNNWCFKHYRRRVQAKLTETEQMLEAANVKISNLEKGKMRMAQEMDDLAVEVERVSTYSSGVVDWLFYVTVECVSVIHVTRIGVQGSEEDGWHAIGLQLYRYLVGLSNLSLNYRHNTAVFVFLINRIPSIDSN